MALKRNPSLCGRPVEEEEEEKKEEEEQNDDDDDDDDDDEGFFYFYKPILFTINNLTITNVGKVQFFVNTA